MRKHTHLMQAHRQAFSSSEIRKPEMGHQNSTAKLHINSPVQVTLLCKRKVISVQLELCLFYCTILWKVLFFILLPRSEVYNPEFDVWYWSDNLSAVKLLMVAEWSNPLDLANLTFYDMLLALNSAELFPFICFEDIQIVVACDYRFHFLGI